MFTMCNIILYVLEMYVECHIIVNLKAWVRDLLRNIIYSSHDIYYLYTISENTLNNYIL